MSILVVQGTHPLSGQLRTDVITGFNRLGRSAGRTLEMVSSATLSDLVARLRSARVGATEFVLIDPGTLAADAMAAPEELRQALEFLPAPFIEIHDCKSVRARGRNRLRRLSSTVTWRQATGSRWASRYAGWTQSPVAR